MNDSSALRGGGAALPEDLRSFQREIQSSTPGLDEPPLAESPLVAEATTRRARAHRAAPPRRTDGAHGTERAGCAAAGVQRRGARPCALAKAHGADAAIAPVGAAGASAWCGCAPLCARRAGARKTPRSVTALAANLACRNKLQPWCAAVGAPNARTKLFSHDIMRAGACERGGRSWQHLCGKIVAVIAAAAAALPLRLAPATQRAAQAQRVASAAALVRSVSQASGRR